MDFSGIVRKSRNRRTKKLRRDLEGIDPDRKSLVTDFIEAMYGQARLTQQMFSVLVYRMGICSPELVGQPGSLKYIQLLPLRLQPLICRKDGRYAENASRDWMHLVEDSEVIMAEMITTDVEVIEAIHSWANETDRELPELPYTDGSNIFLSREALEAISPFMVEEPIVVSADEVDGETF